MEVTWTLGGIAASTAASTVAGLTIAGPLGAAVGAFTGVAISLASAASVFWKRPHVLYRLRLPKQKWLKPEQALDQDASSSLRVDAAAASLHLDNAKPYP